MQKKYSQDYSLNLNRITLHEYLMFPDTFNEYRTLVVGLLKLKEIYLFEETILKDFALDADKTIKTTEIEKRSEILKKILETTPMLLKTGHKRKDKKGKTHFVYIDLATMYVVEPQDLGFDSFFTRRLRQLDLLEINDFLAYHFQKSYNNNLLEYSQFLQLCMRKYQQKLVLPAITDTVLEWLTYKEKQQEQEQGLKGTPANKQTSEISKKGKIKREANDQKTRLNQEQSVLLLHFLQQERFFLKDEYLNNTEAGLAFETLTGYSHTTTRQNLGKINSSKTRFNLTAIYNFLTSLKLSIEKTFKEIKKIE